jgi:Holliday junction resolvase RusA-like endonuclease
MTEEFRIYYPKDQAGKKRWSKLYGLNAYYSATKHWAQRKQDAEYWHLLTRSAMNKQGVRSRPYEKPVEISFLWNDRLDIDNHSIMGKMIVDAMKGRIIKDDNRQWLKAVYHSFHDEDYILVQVREIENGQ